MWEDQEKWEDEINDFLRSARTEDAVNNVGMKMENKFAIVAAEQHLTLDTREEG